MNSEILIQIDWPWALGIVGLLILLAWKGSSRFTKIETDVDWLKDKINDIKASIDNTKIDAFRNASPVALTEIGTNFLDKSGMKDYIDNNKETLVNVCNEVRNTNAYEVQKHIFKYFDNVEFDVDHDKQIKNFAYNKGISTDILRRAGAIYFRDVCLKEFDMKAEDIDNHQN